MTKISPCQILLPMSLTAFVLFGFLAFQASQIFLERQSLNQARSQQDKPLEETRKIQAQFSALAIGTKKLAENGDKNAAAIVNRLKQAGIGFTEPPSASAPAEGKADQDAASTAAAQK